MSSHWWTRGDPLPVPSAHANGPALGHKWTADHPRPRRHRQAFPMQASQRVFHESHPLRGRKRFSVPEQMGKRFKELPQGQWGKPVSTGLVCLRHACRGGLANPPGPPVPGTSQRCLRDPCRPSKSRSRPTKQSPERLSFQPAHEEPAGWSPPLEGASYLLGGVLACRSFRLASLLSPGLAGSGAEGATFATGGGAGGVSSFFTSFSLKKGNR